MSIVRIVKNIDDTISVVKSVNGASLDIICKKAKIDHLPYEDINESELPSDRKYREAWRKKSGEPITFDTTVIAIIDDAISKGKKTYMINNKIVAVKQ